MYDGGFGINVWWNGSVLISSSELTCLHSLNLREVNEFGLQ